MKRRKPLSRGKPPKRGKGPTRKTPLQARQRPQKPRREPGPDGSDRVHPQKGHGPYKRSYKKGRTRRRTPAVGTALSAFVVQYECQPAALWPLLPPCWGRLEVHHVRARGMGRGRGDWVKLPDGQIVGNVVAACREHHEWCELHPAESRPVLLPVAQQLGEWAIEGGIVPVLHEQK